MKAQLSAVNIGAVNGTYLSPNDTLFCQGGTSIFKAHIAPFNTNGITYSWGFKNINNAGSTSLSTSDSIATLSTTSNFSLQELIIGVVATDTIGNQFTDSLRIFIASNISANSNLPDSICENDNKILLTGMPAGGTFSSIPSGFITAIGSNQYFNPSSVTSQSIVTVTYTYTDTAAGLSCQKSESETIVVSPLPSVSVSVSPSSIEKCQGSFTVSSTPPGGFFTLDGVLTTLINNQINSEDLSVGTHMIQYTYTNSAGCTATDSATFNVTKPTLYAKYNNGSIWSFATWNVSTSTFRICGVSYQSQLFKLILTQGPSSYSSYNIDWGDGTIDSNSYNSDPTHNYTSAGLYNVTFSVYTASGCQIIYQFNIFYGTNPTAGLSTLGGSTRCLIQPGDSAKILFEIANWDTYESGVVLSFTSNHDQDTVTAVTPLVVNGVPVHPSLRDSINGKLYFIKYFHYNSCGKSGILNAFSVKLQVTSPCGSVPSSALAWISSVPTADFSGPQTECTDSWLTLFDATTGGASIGYNSSTQNSDCDTVFMGTWKISPMSTGNPSLQTGSLLGSTGLNVSDPTTWTPGTSNITLKFNNPGTYTITRYTGTSSNLSTCRIDSITKTICIDTIPIVELLSARFDTVCPNDTLNSVLKQDSINCGLQTYYSMSIIPLGSSIPVSRVSDTIPSLSLQVPFAAGNYLIRYIDSNQCGYSELYDSILVLALPEVQFIQDSLSFCTDTLIANLGFSPHDFTVNTLTSGAQFDNVAITPTTGWTQSGVNSIGLPILTFFNPGTYFITISYSNECGIGDATQIITINPLPDPAWALTDSSGCSPFTANVLSVSGVSGVTHNWKVFDGSGAIIQSLTGASPSFAALVNTSFTTNASFSIRHIVSVGTTGCSDSLDIPVTVFPTPDANFNIAAQACALTSLSTTDASQGKALTYQWSVYGYSSGQWLSTATTISNTTVASPSFGFPNFQYPSADSTYKIKLVVTSSDGCVDSIVKDVTILARPLAQFPALTNSCGPISTVLTNNSAVNSPRTLSYLWSTSGSGATLSSATATNPTLTVATPVSDSLTYTITLIATDDQGCSDTTQQDITVYALPTASFTGLPSAGCDPLTLNLVNTSISGFTSQASPTGLTFLWTIKQGTTTTFTSSSSTPSFTLTNTGTIDSIYFLSLIVTNDKGCVDSITDSITIHPHAKAEIIAPMTTACAPFTIDVNSASAASYPQANASLSWTIYDFSSNILYGPSTVVNYTITAANDSVIVVLNATSLHGCENHADSVVFRTLTNPDPAFYINPNDSICDGNTINFSINNVVTGTIYNLYQRFNGGTYALINTGSSISSQTLTNTSVTGYGHYEFKLLATNGNTQCSDSSIISIYVYPNPIPSISYPVSCGSDTITFSGTTTNNSQIANYSWVINGDTINGASIQYYFGQSGHYPISLTTLSINGCLSIVTDTITVNEDPIASIQFNSNCGIDTICVNQNIQYNSNSTIGSISGPIANHLWDIGNNGVTNGVLSSINHAFSTIGAKSIRLQVTTTEGCIDDTIINLFVIEPPTLSFNLTSDSLCGPVSPLYNASATGDVDSSYFELFAWDQNGIKITVQSWPGSIFTMPTLQPNYRSDTLYQFSYTALNCCGTTTKSDSIYIKTPPVADFIIVPDTGCSPLGTVIQLDGLILGDPDSARIDFGDGMVNHLTPTKTLQGSKYIYVWGQLNHTFIYNGTSDTTFYISLTVYNECGDSSITKSVYLQAKTTQAFFTVNKNQGCAPLTVQFTDNSFNATNSFWCFDWDRNSLTCGGMSSVNNNTSWTFTQAGTYTVALFVDNGCGYDTAYQDIIVNPSPDAIASATSNVCQGDSVYFTSLSTIPSGSIIGYHWNFGDGGTSMLQNPIHIYQTSGSFQAQLIVTSSNGCQDSVTFSTYIQSTPDIDISVGAVCEGDSTYFFNYSTVVNANIVGIHWDFGDGNTSNTFAPIHLYSSPGTYVVQLTLTSNFGCTTDSTLLVMVYPKPILQVNPVMVSGDSCSVPQTYLFNNNSTNAISNSWDFDFYNNPGVNTSSVNSPQFTFTTAGIYHVALFAESAFSCKDTLIIPIRVHDGVISQGYFTPVSGCEPLDVLFVNQSIYSANLDTITQIKWNFGDGSVSISTTDSLWHTYDDYGLYSVSLTVEMSSGCRDSTYIGLIQVHPTPKADFQITKINLSTRLFTNLTSIVDTSVNYLWSFGDNQFSTDLNPIHQYDANISGLDSIDVCLWVENSFGCKDSTCQTFWLWPPMLTVPNALAPDLDYVGEDNRFLPKGHSLGHYELWIYDKWGNLVFYTDKLDSEGKPLDYWDGLDRSTGKPCPMGVYAWRINAVFDDGTRWIGQNDKYQRQRPYGTLTLIR